MKIYVMDAFAAKLFGGNQAGGPAGEGRQRRDHAPDRRRAEAFGNRLCPAPGRWQRGPALFYPGGEVELCGHATIAGFALLRRLGLLDDGRHVAHTKAGNLQISVDGEVVWMDMAPPVGWES